MPISAFDEIDEHIADARREVAELRRDAESQFSRVVLQVRQLQTDMNAVKDNVAELKGENRQRRYRQARGCLFRTPDRQGAGRQGRGTL